VARAVLLFAGWVEAVPPQAARRPVVAHTMHTPPNALSFVTVSILVMLIELPYGVANRTSTQ
jgi:hypothetical protein